MRHRMTFTSEAAQRRIEKIQQILRGQDLSLQEIADEIHMSLKWARAYVVYLHKQKQLHIAAWDRRMQNNYRRTTPLYCWGAAKDAERPAPLTDAESQRQRRKRVYADAFKHEEELARRRMQRFVPHRDWASSWIPTKGTT